MSAPQAPTGVEVHYRDGAVVVPDEVSYVGYDQDRGLHIWMAHLPRPIQPGLAKVTVATLPGRTEVICG